MNIAIDNYLISGHSIREFRITLPGDIDIPGELCAQVTEVLEELLPDGQELVEHALETLLKEAGDNESSAQGIVRRLLLKLTAENFDTIKLVSRNGLH